MNLSESEFQKQINLVDLQGEYKNHAERKGAEIDIFLSQLIWPEDDSLDHHAVTKVEVIKLSERTLLVKAWDKESILKSGEYVEGKDFSLQDGRIKLGLGGGANLEPEAGVVAVHYENKEIGLDKSGHGRYQSSGVVTGVAMLVIPVMAAGVDDARFMRLK